MGVKFDGCERPVADSPDRIPCIKPFFLFSPWPPIISFAYALHREEMTPFSFPNQNLHGVIGPRYSCQLLSERVTGC